MSIHRLKRVQRTSSRTGPNGGQAERCRDLIMLAPPGRPVTVTRGLATEPAHYAPVDPLRHPISSSATPEFGRCQSITNGAKLFLRRRLR
jgi:hypothetical protein